MEKMQGHAERVKAAISACGALVTGLFGWLGSLAAVYVLAMALDYATGTIAALKTRTWRSATAREGIWHKTGCIITVAAAALTDWMLSLAVAHLPMGGEGGGYTALLCPLVMIWYIMTELGSVVENARKLGAPVPGFLAEAIKRARDKLGQGRPRK